VTLRYEEEVFIENEIERKANSLNVEIDLKQLDMMIDKCRAAKDLVLKMGV
jgi:hypothetical protein